MDNSRRGLEPLVSGESCNATERSGNVTQMSFGFLPMKEEYARAIVDGWRCGTEYSVYDYVHEAEHMLDAGGCRPDPKQL